MLGIWQVYASQFLYLIAIGTVIFFGLPMIIAPLWWARLLGWRIPAEINLAVYFGRCLGSVICVLAYFAFVAAASTDFQRYYFQMLLGAFLAMVLVHIYGAIRKIQPCIESLEIVYWLALFIVTLCFYPTR